VRLKLGRQLIEREQPDVIWVIVNFVSLPWRAVCGPVRGHRNLFASSDRVLSAPSKIQARKSEEKPKRKAISFRRILCLPANRTSEISSNQSKTRVHC
jgi:hypothetical protein